nr:hypothetical protein GCM10025730_23020 [Promicromonospora thailandica]
MIQDSVPSEASSDVRMVGSATFTIVVSRSAMETPRMSTASATQEERGAPPGAVEAVGAAAAGGSDVTTGSYVAAAAPTG